MVKKSRVEKLICGIDISSNTLDICYQKSATDFEYLKIENNLNGFQKLLKKCGSTYQFVMEATGVYHLNLIFFLHENELDFSVLNALQIKRYIQMHLERNKSDKKDARYICNYGIDRRPELSELADKEYYRCKSLNNSIETITNEITMFSNKLHSQNRVPVACKAVETSYLAIIENLKKELKNIESELNKCLNEWQGKLVERVSSVVGIGKRATAEVIVYTQAFKNMTNYRQLICFSGLNPKEYSSGSSIRGKAKICKQGGGRLRHILYMCALNAKTNNKACKALYDRLVEAGKNKKIALIAVCNKLLKQIYGVVKNQTIFNNNYSIN
jgi:transposase